jgi:hypothetical protein
MTDIGEVLGFNSAAFQKRYWVTPISKKRGI